MYEIKTGDCLEILRTMESETIQCCVTSPPYWGLRDYGNDKQIGREETPAEFVENMVQVFREVRRVLKDDGTLWLNLGDSYASDSKGSGGPSAKQDSNKGSRCAVMKCQHGLKQKDLVGIPWRVALALQADGWYLRSDIIWHKRNPMPESVTDRPTKAHEYLFLLTKSPRYYYDADAIKEKAIKGVHTRKRSSNFKKAILNGSQMSSKEIIEYDGMKNKRSVWSLVSKPFKSAHFATMPETLVEPCIKAGSKEGDLVLDPFNGAATVGLVANRYYRKYIGIELNPEYVEISRKRLDNDAPLFHE